MVTPLQTLGNWFTGGKKPRHPAIPSDRPPPVRKSMSGHTHTYELEKSRGGIDGHHVKVQQSSRIPEGPNPRHEHKFHAAYDGPRRGKEYEAFNRMSDRRNAGQPYTYSLGGASDDGRTPAPVSVAKVDTSPVRSASSRKSSPARSASAQSKVSARTQAHRPSLSTVASDRSIHSWRTGVSRDLTPSKDVAPAGMHKLAFDPIPALLAEELDIQSRRTFAVPAPCHVTIFPPGPQKAHATALKPPNVVMRTSTGQSAGPAGSVQRGTGAGGGLGFPPFPPFPAFPSFPAFPAWPTFPAPQAHGR